MFDIFCFFALFIGGGWFIGKLIGGFIPDEKPFNNDFKDKTTIINNITENHLHVSKEDLKSIIEKK